MAIESIGYYALPVIPSFEGMDKQVNASMSKSFGGLGKKLGVDFGGGVGKGLKQSEQQIKKSAAAVSDALDKVKDATGSLRAEEAKLATARSNAAARAQAVATAEKRLEELRRKGTATDKQKAAAEKQVASARERARTAGSQAVGIEQRVESARRAETRATREAKRAEEDLADARKRAKPATGLAGMLGLGGDSSGTAVAAGLAKTAGMTIGKALLGGAGLILAGAGVAELGRGFVNILQGSIETGLGFERQANKFQGVTRASAAEMEQMRATARALGSDTQLAGASAADAALAITELAKGGLSVADAMTAARGTLQLATAAQVDAAEAATIQANAMAMFSLGAEDATHVADLLANATIASSAELPDLALALSQGGSAAAGFGVSIEETLAALTMFSKMGINSSDAGTLFKTSLQSITDQGAPAQEAINTLGLQLYDLDGTVTGTIGKFVGYREMMRQVGEASKRMTEEQFQAQTNVLFGSDAMRASMIVGNQGIELFDESAEALKRQGAAAEMAAANMQGLPGVYEGIANTWEAIELNTFESIDAIAQSMGGGVLEGLESISNGLANSKPEMIAFFTGIGQAAIGMGAEIASGVEVSVDLLAGLVNAVGDTYGAITKVGAGIKRLTGDDEGARQWEEQAEAGFGLADGLEAIVDRAGEARERMNALSGTLGKAGTDAQNTAEMARALGDGVKAIPTGATITVESNQPEVLKRLEELGFEIKELPEGRVEIFAETQGAKDAADAWRRAEEEKRVDVPVGVNTETAEQQLKTLFDRYPMLNPQPGPSTATNPAGGLAGVMTVPGVTGPPRADGGIFDGLRKLAIFANGGMLPGEATIQKPAGAAGLVQWAEKETEGEAFIPLSKRKRKRSEKIWRETGKRLGMKSFVDGGFLTRDDVESIGRSFGLEPTSKYRAEEGSFHSTNQAVDLSNGSSNTDQMLAFAQYMAQNYGAQLKELIYDDPRFSTQVDEGKRVGAEFFANAGNHTNHVHIATVGMSGQPSGLAELGAGGAGSGLAPMMSAPLSGSSSKEQIAGAIAAEASRRGYSQQTGTAAVGASLLESGLNPNVTNSTGHQSLFQTSADKGVGLDPNAQIKWFFDEMDKLGGPAAANADPLNFIADKIEKGGYPGSNYQKHLGEAAELIRKGGSMNGYAAGIDPETGEAGYYAPDPEGVREAERDVRDAEQKVAIQEQQVRELKEDASVSQRMAAEDEARRAREDRDEAYAKLDEAKRGKFTKGKAGSASSAATGGAGAESELGGIGSIASQFLKDTFGLGDLFPDPSQLGIVKLAQAVMGIKYTPQGTGFKGGLLEGTPGALEMTQPGGALDAASGGGGLPFGMIPGIASALPTPDGTGVDHMPGGVPTPPGPPQNVDQSMHVTLNNPQGTPESNEQRVRRTLLNTPRLGTYQHNPGVMGK